jgi:serine/threonine protein kinase
MGVFSKSQIEKKYVIDKKELGSGNFAVVKRATLKPGAKDVPAGMRSECAVKIIDKAKVEDMNDIQREIEVMEQLKHDNVIKLFEIFDEPKKMMLVMELVTGGELFDRIVSKGSYTEADAAGVLLQLCDALNYMHEKKIVHRDLKPENILYSTADEDSPIKVADFGLARVISNKEMMKTACGTPGYVAPEVLKNKGYDSGAVDMWSTGVILYILLCGFPPFYEEELPALFEQILHARYDFPSPWWDNVSPEAKSLVKGLLTIDPVKRLTAAQVMALPWVSGSAPTADLSGAQAAMKKYNATRKLKKAAMGLMAKHRMAKLMEAGRALEAGGS